MEPKRTNGTLIGLILMTLVAGIFAYLYFEEKKINELQGLDLESRITEIASAEIKLDNLSRELDAKIAEVEILGGDVAELKKVKAQLEADRLSLRKGNANLGAKIKEYEIFLRAKDEEIAQLREENQQLLSDKQELLSTTENLNREKQTVQDSLSGVIARTQELEGKVALGAALKARDVKVYAVSAKGKVRDGESVKSKRIDRIRVDFMLEKNPLAIQNTKSIYMRVIDPDGATISNTSTGSGTFEIQGEVFPFTISKDVDYTNSNQDVSIMYERSGDFKKGTHIVQLFTEGFLIGEGTFSVK